MRLAGCEGINLVGLPDGRPPLWGTQARSDGSSANVGHGRGTRPAATAHIARGPMRLAGCEGINLVGLPDGRPPLWGTQARSDGSSANVGHGRGTRPAATAHIARGPRQVSYLDRALPRCQFSVTSSRRAGIGLLHSMKSTCLCATGDVAAGLVPRRCPTHAAGVFRYIAGQNPALLTAIACHLAKRSLHTSTGGISAKCPFHENMVLPPRFSGGKACSSMASNTNPALNAIPNSFDSGR